MNNQIFNFRHKKREKLILKYKFIVHVDSEIIQRTKSNEEEVKKIKEIVIREQRKDNECEGNVF